MIDNSETDIASRDCLGDLNKKLLPKNLHYAMLISLLPMFFSFSTTRQENLKARFVKGSRKQKLGL